jgi:hypothetical protein
LGIPPRDQPPHHYRLLGIELYEGDPEVIEAAAERHSTYLQAVASGPQVAESQRLLNEISAARRCLLTAAQKSAYDAKLREKLAAAETPSSTNVTPPPVSAKSPSPAEAKLPQFDIGEPATRAAATKPKPAKPAATPSNRRRKTAVWPLIVIVLLVVVTGVGAGMFALGVFDSTNKPASNVASTAAPTPPPTTNPAQGSALAAASGVKASVSPTKTEPAAPAATKSAASPAPAATPSPSAQLVAHYSFDDAAALAKDAVGTLHGTNHKGKSLVDPERGTVLQLVDKAYVELPAKLTPDATVAFWMRTSKVGGFTTSWERGVPVLSAANELRVVLVGNTLGLWTRGYANLFDTEQPAVNNNKWYHVAILRRQSLKQIVVYVGGREANRKTGWQDSKEPAGAVLLGQTELGDLHFEGLLDDLRIYNSAISEAEIQSLAKPGANANGKPAPPKPETKTPQKTG